MMKRGLLATALACALAFGTAAHAEESQKLTITLQLDSAKVIINGVESEGEAPYSENGTTLVPLRIVTTAFGAALQWNGETQGITLTRGDTVLKLQIDSYEALVNGESRKLEEAPRLKNSTAMVPLRFISENFGAQVGFDPATDTVTITADPASPQAAKDKDGIEIDTGKTRIGSSYYSWSMKYPTDLVKSYMSFKEDYVNFNDAKEEFNLTVSVDEEHDTLSNDGLLKRITEEMDSDDTLLDKRIVKDQGKSYARLLTKYDNTYYEVRLYQANGNLYTIYFSTEEEQFKNTAKNKGYQDLLDSFSTDYDKADSALKDLSTVKDGVRSYTEKETGITLRIPAAWSMYKTDGTVQFGNKDETESFAIRMTSAEEGDTLAKWVDRDRRYLTDEYVPAYFTISQPQDMQISGIPSKLLEYSLQIGEDWAYIYDYYLFKNGYKYEFIFNSNKSNSALAASLISSVSLSDDTNSALGYIYDERDYKDRTKLEERSFKSKGFALSTPLYWNQTEDKKNNRITFESSLFEMTVWYSDTISKEQFLKLLQASLKSNEGPLQGIKVLSSDVTEDTLAGKSASKIVSKLQYKGGVEYTSTNYVIEHNSKTYLVTQIVRDEIATEANLALYSDVLKSFRFLE